MKFQMSILRDIIYGAADQGVDFNRLCNDLKISPESLNDAEQMIDWELAPYLWDHIVNFSGDQAIGLRMGKNLRPSLFGIMGHLLQTCKDLREVLEALARYGDTWSTIFTLRVEQRDSLVHFYFNPVLLYKEKYPVSAKQATDLGISGTLSLLELLSGKKVHPQKLYVPYPKHEGAAYYPVCQCEVSFDSPASYFVFHESQLRTPVLSHDRSLFFMFTTLLEKKQKELEHNETFAEHVQHILISEFKGQVPPIAVVAARMCLTTRSFQRRLSADHTTYRKLCKNLQKTLASAMMQKSNRRISDVASLMGYADHTTFRRAFNKWNQPVTDIRQPSKNI
jgi:AraC-like DNA-binding protein